MSHQFIREQAWRFLLKQKINYLPIDPLALAFQLDYAVFPYEKAASLLNTTPQWLANEFDNDGYCFWSDKLKKFVICYNSALPFSICRWTILHEIAHIYLQHIPPKAEKLDRIRAPFRTLFEIEAQGFARRVLCPSIVLHHCRAFQPDEIMQLCGISREAARYRSEHMKILESRNQFRLHPLERKVEKQFLPFINYYNQKQEVLKKRIPFF